MVKRTLEVWWADMQGTDRMVAGYARVDLSAAQPPTTETLQRVLAGLRVRA